MPHPLLRAVMLRLLAAVSLLSVFAGRALAQGAPSRPADVRVAVSASPAAAFARVVAAFGSEGLTIGESSTASGRVASRPTTLDEPNVAAVVVRADIAPAAEGSLVTLSALRTSGRAGPSDAAVKRRLERLARAVAAPR